MLYYKMDILEKLKQKGITTYTLRKSGIIGQKTITAIKAGEMIGTKTIDTVCNLLHCQPGTLIGWKPDETQPAAADAPEAGPAE